MYGHDKSDDIVETLYNESNDPEDFHLSKEHYTCFRWHTKIEK